ncbi:hypothetical protein O0L34_g14259 [Tuta absoluta]|nr:hypothetical protein O0L34_g14259 [Tuta absoluta]
MFKLTVYYSSSEMGSPATGRQTKALLPLPRREPLESSLFPPPLPPRHTSIRNTEAVAQEHITLRTDMAESSTNVAQDWPFPRPHYIENLKVPKRTKFENVLAKVTRKKKIRKEDIGMPQDFRHIEGYHKVTYKFPAEYKPLIEKWLGYSKDKLNNIIDELWDLELSENEGLYSELQLIADSINTTKEQRTSTNRITSTNKPNETPIPAPRTSFDINGNLYGNVPQKFSNANVNPSAPPLTLDIYQNDFDANVQPSAPPLTPTETPQMYVGYCDF